MSCEICGRGNCCKSFHSLEEQERFDSVADNIKERTASIIKSELNGLDCIEGENNDVLIRLDDALRICDDYY